jgi:hypothetical protein
MVVVVFHYVELKGCGGMSDMSDFFATNDASQQTIFRHKFGHFGHRVFYLSGKKNTPLMCCILAICDIINVLNQNMVQY